MVSGGISASGVEKNLDKDTWFVFGLVESQSRPLIDRRIELYGIRVLVVAASC